MAIFYIHQTDRYVDTMDDLVLLYNYSKHQTIRMPPSDVTTHDEPELMMGIHNIPVPKKTNAVISSGVIASYSDDENTVQERIHWSMVR